MKAEEAVADFLAALRRHAPRFGVEMSAQGFEQLGEYYKIVMLWNPRLHLVAPCTAEEFATRHVLESLFALRHLTDGARLTDVGSGGGLPAIPCLVALPNLRATLIESSTKKGVFLREAVRAVGARARANVIAKRFEEVETPPADFISCRAIERFAEKLKELVAWSPPASKLLFFAGAALREEIERAGLNYQALLIPETERRFLFVIER